MCGRFAITLSVQTMAGIFAAVPSNDVPDGARYNVCPTQQVAVCTAEGPGGARRLRAMRWGFVPQWYDTHGGGPLLINARSESVAQKPAFRAAVRERRCLIPADGFYEWHKAAGGARLPWYVTRADGAPMVFAGIWQDWDRGDQHLTACAILTTPSGPDIAHIHDRAPLILDPGAWAKWLGEAGPGAARLMQPPPVGTLVAHRVGVAVNSSRAQGPDLRAPLPDAAI